MPITWITPLGWLCLAIAFAGAAYLIRVQDRNS